MREVISNLYLWRGYQSHVGELCKVSPGEMEALGARQAALNFWMRTSSAATVWWAFSPNLDISEIPDEAFNPAFGDDTATASALKKRNKRERTGQMGFRLSETKATSEKIWCSG